MKTFIYILIALLAIFFIYNVTMLDWSNLLEGNSFIATIGTLASACGILLLAILLISKKIAAKKR